MSEGDFWRTWRRPRGIGVAMLMDCRRIGNGNLRARRKWDEVSYISGTNEREKRPSEQNSGARDPSRADGAIEAAIQTAGNEDRLRALPPPPKRLGKAGRVWRRRGQSYRQEPRRTAAVAKRAGGLGPLRHRCKSRFQSASLCHVEISCLIVSLAPTDQCRVGAWRISESAVRMRAIMSAPSERPVGRWDFHVDTRQIVGCH